MLNILGIDTSSTATALVLTKNKKIISFTLIQPKSKNITTRCLKIIRDFETFISENKIDMINLESIAYGAKGRTTDLAMLLGAIYYYCLKKGIKTNLVAPTQLKKSFCSNGRASKDDMIYFMRDNFPTEFNKFKAYKKIDDLVDAFALSIYT